MAKATDTLSKDRASAPARPARRRRSSTVRSLVHGLQDQRRHVAARLRMLMEELEDERAYMAELDAAVSALLAA